MAPENDSDRSRRLLFAPELATGRLQLADLARTAVREAARSRRVPAAPSRAYQRSLVRSGALSYEGETVPRAMAARHAVLGDDATGPPRLLVRVDAFPHPLALDQPARYGAERFRAVHEILAEAGLRYLLPVTPRVSRRPLDRRGREHRRLDDAELELVAQLRHDGVTFAAHGLDHRTRRHGARRPAELAGLSMEALGERLDLAAEELAEAAIRPDVLVPPFERFDWRQWDTLAERYSVIAGGPDSVGHFGYHDTPLWRHQAVWAPAYPPLHGGAAEAGAAVRRLSDQGAALWVPVALDWGRESDAGLADLARFAREAAALSTDWEEFLAAVRFSRGVTE